jgi:KipI family sensor histidine kinase inhibitor
MTAARLLPVGVSAWLVEVADEAHVLPLARHLATLRDTGRLAGVVDVVPGARTVLLDGGRLGRRAVQDAVEGFSPSGSPGDRDRPRVDLPVTYDGDDLDDVARLTGLTTREVVEHHTGAELTVAFCGFNAGFAYLRGLPPVLHVPRLEAPRTAVPAGSVAIAEEFAGVYPRRSPGGWRLLGRTGTTLWDASRTPPALLTPGTRVRFVAG